MNTSISSPTVEQARAYMDSVSQSIEDAKEAAHRSVEEQAKLEVAQPRPADWGYRSFYVSIAALVLSLTGGMILAVPAGIISILLSIIARTKQESSLKPANQGFLISLVAIAISIALIVVGRVAVETMGR